MVLPLEIEARIKRIEEIVSRLEDDRAIRELLALYGYTADAGQDELWAALFTEDGGINGALGQTPDGNNPLRKGKPALLEFIAQSRTRHSEPPGQAMHLNGNNLTVTIDGDRAVAQSYSLNLRKGIDGNIWIFDAANNHWILRKINGRWLIEERRRRQVGAPGYVSNVVSSSGAGEAAR